MDRLNMRTFGSMIHQTNGAPDILAQVEETRSFLTLLTAMNAIFNETIWRTGLNNPSCGLNSQSSTTSMPCSSITQSEDTHKPSKLGRPSYEAENPRG